LISLRKLDGTTLTLYRGYQSDQCVSLMVLDWSINLQQEDVNAYLLHEQLAYLLYIYIYIYDKREVKMSFFFKKTNLQNLWPKRKELESIQAEF
jgi:hypothetical protein